MTEEYKRLIQFAIRNTIKYEMLDRRMGQWDEVLKTHVFSDAEYIAVNELIKNEDFPCGFYKLCDLIGEKYVKS